VLVELREVVQPFGQQLYLLQELLEGLRLLVSLRQSLLVVVDMVPGGKIQIQIVREDQEYQLVAVVVVDQMEHQDQQLVLHSQEQ
jgi:hypothetical protein